MLTPQGGSIILYAALAGSQVVPDIVVLWKDGGEIVNHYSTRLADMTIEIMRKGGGEKVHAYVDFHAPLG